MAGVGVIIVLFVVFLMSSIKVLNEYERGVIFRLGRLTPYRGPGVIILIPILERMVRIDLRIVPLEIPPQDVITRDNVTRESQRGALLPRDRSVARRDRSQ